MPSYARRKDGTHDLIRDTLAALGWDMIDAYQFAQFDAGFPDLIALKGGKTVFVEVKTKSGKLTDDERKWRMVHPGAEHQVIRTAGECVLMDAKYRLAR